jgi:threonine/homoserine/homoserine lactone efflux protein
MEPERQAFYYKGLMLAALGTVIVTSLSGVMAPGPMFAMTLAKSLKSQWAGVLVSLGHAVIEVPLIILIYFGLVQFFNNTIVQLTLSILGGSFIIWMGVGLFRARHKIVREGRDTPYNAFVAGILMSGLNPFFLVWWVIWGSLMLINFLKAVGDWALPLFIIVHWLCDLVWLSLVSITVYRTHSFWSQKVQEMVFVILSAALVYFGGQFFIQGLDVYFGADNWNWVRYIFWSLLALFMAYWLWQYFGRRAIESEY